MSYKWCDINRSQAGFIIFLLIRTPHPEFPIQTYRECRHPLPMLQTKPGIIIEPSFFLSPLQSNQALNSLLGWRMEVSLNPNSLIRRKRGDNNQSAVSQDTNLARLGADYSHGVLINCTTRSCSMFCSLFQACSNSFKATVVPGSLIFSPIFHFICLTRLH